MSPNDQEYGPATQEKNMVSAADGDRVVISGMAGLYPQSRYVKDLDNILYNKVNPVSEESLRWKYNHPEVAQYTGNVPELDRFDAQFFKVHYRQGHLMDPLGRKLLEQAYGAIYDAGINPDQLNGKKVGVFIGTSMSESEKISFYDSTEKSGLGLTGCSKTMFANRISYWLNVKGPSLNIDEACCSSTAALEQAFQAIARGDCESAIVGGANLCLHPHSALHFGRALALAADGKTRSFDQNATGTAVSEAINVLYLQRAKDALRIYAEVLNVKCGFSSVTNMENSLKMGFSRNSKDNANFLRDFYAQTSVSPSLVEYVEAFGAADPETDKAELNALDVIFCKDRKEPLLVGSVMSNIGYSSAASGIAAVTKVLLGYNKGKLAGNLHCDTPRNDVVALSDNRIRILNDHQDFRPTYTAVNSLSITGVNGHVLLHGHPITKDNNRYKCDIPYLVIASGRQESAVEKIFNELKAQPIDPEQLALLHNLHVTKISGHLSRGFIILDKEEQKTVSLSERADYFDGTQRPLWFVYSGMGSQWAGMGTQLMRIPIFAAAIKRCRRVLEPKGIDIDKIITSTDKSIFDNILYSFVGIAAMQIGLTDVLHDLGLVPDKIIGHSVGELGCAYADGCLTAEEVILSAYSRGLASIETLFINGAMAAIGAGFKQVSKICPPEIVIACHNGPDSCTISGPSETMGDFITYLTSKGIFAKEVPCSNIAFHSQYIAEAGPLLLKYLKEIIVTPKLRSERWVSTSVPQDRWEESIAKHSSAEYHTNNLLSPVLFEEASKLIPSNAVLVEVAPHGLLQAILKRSLPDSCINISLTRRGHQDNVVTLLEAVGTLYIEGYHPKIQRIYPKVDFPVSNGTPFLSHLVEWAHEEKWNLVTYLSADRKVATSSEYLISVYDDEHSYLKGHVIRRNTLLPFSFGLVAVWDTLLMAMHIQKKKMNVEFNDIQFYVQPIIYEYRNNRLSVSIQKGSGRFEIMNEKSRVATGYIKVSEINNKKGLLDALHSSDETFELSTEDVYQLFNEIDCFYSGEFRSIESANNAMTKANLIWNNNWVTLIDGALQLNAMKYQQNSASQLDQIGRITINVTDHLKSSLEKDDGTCVISTCIDDLQNFTRCGGLVIENVKFNKLLPVKDDVTVSLKSLKFVPRFHSGIDSLASFQIMIQIVAENINKNIINVIGITDENSETGIFNGIEMKCKNIPGVKMQYREVRKNSNVSLEDADLVVVQNLWDDEHKCQIMYCTLKSNAFIINEQSLDDISRMKPSSLYDIVSILKMNKTCLELARWRSIPLIPTKSRTILTVRSKSDLSLMIEARKNISPQDCLVILTPHPPVVGLKHMVKKRKTEGKHKRICFIMTNELNDVKDLPNDDLVFHMLSEGVWGGEYYLPSRENTATCEKIMLQSEHVGNFDSLQWIHGPEDMDNKNIIKVHYAALHVNDVKRAAGTVLLENMNSTIDKGYGMEFSGFTKSGARVMGLVQNGAASSYVLAKPELLWPVPSYWTLEDAATVPFAYVYAYYCLYIKTAIRLVEKDVTQFSVLVHGGTGALGQAMISIALAKGFKVFATVSDIRKKRFLLRLFPELNEGDIGNSRDTSFGDMVMSATGGKGCNIVMCCLKGELKNISLNCCSSSGTTFDTVAINTKENYQFGMCYLTNERAYIPVDIASIFTHMTSKDLTTIQTMMSDGITIGHVRPLTRVTYSVHEAPRAFRLLAGSRHRGRVLLRMQHSQLLLTQPRFTCVRDHSHLILCDTKQLGIQLVDRLISCGGNKIHIHIPNMSSLLQYRLRCWQKLNVQVSVSSEDLNNDANLFNLVKKATHCGPLDGVYVVADNSSRNQITSNLDIATRKICSSLKYFIVLSDNGTIGQDTVSCRVKDALPATLLDLSTLKNFFNSDAIYCRKAIDATVLALNTSDSTLLAQPLRLPELSLLQQIAVLADVNITNETSDESTLENLGMDPGKSEAVAAFLSNTYHISLFEDNIPSLTIQYIKELDSRSREPKLDDVKGLHTLFSYVDPEEIQATNGMVFMPSLTNRSTLRDDEFDVNETFLCIIPGLEGHHGRFRMLCKRLKLPTFVLQPGLDHPEETPQQLARRFAEILLKKMGQKDSFYLLGYEFGVIVALELASILEDHGKTGTVYCLGDGPEEIKALLKSELSVFETEIALQTGVAQHMLALMANSSDLPAIDELPGCSWDERIHIYVRTLLGRLSHSAQYALAILQAAYTRLNTARRYNAVPRMLRSQLILMRARHAVRSDEESSLHRYTAGALVIQDLDVPLVHATTDLKVPAIINRYLDEKILLEFEKKNLCETYLINADRFMMSTRDNS